MKPMIFYDGGCGLCRKEIAHYKRLDTLNRIIWVDIFNEPKALEALGIDFYDAMAVLHGRDEHGDIIKGVENFIIIWENLGGYRYLARFISRFKLLPAMHWGYETFANWRFKRRMKKGCVKERFYNDS